MALTRKFLKGLEIDDDKIDQIITAHTEVTDALKEQAAEATETKKKYDELIKENDELKKKSENDKSSEKIAELEKEIEVYKSEKVLNNKKEAYINILKEAGIDEKRFNSIIKLTDFNGIEIEDGKIKDADKISESVKTDYADFIVKTETNVTKPNTPPATKTEAIDPFIAGFDGK